MSRAPSSISPFPELALADAGDGALSLLEYRYVRYVERPHGLPAAKRQKRVRQRTGNRYLDNLYEEYRVCIELDGTAAHPADEQRADKRRDNWNLVHGNILTLRFGFLDLTEYHRCATAQDVAARLTLSGWPGRPRPCPRPGCPVSGLHENSSTPAQQNSARVGLCVYACLTPLRGGNNGGGAGERVEAGGGLRERDHVTNGLHAG
jgi:hypothetical protein